MISSDNILEKGKWKHNIAVATLQYNERRLTLADL